MFEELIALSESIYNNNLSKGFWKKGELRNEGEAVGLMVGELYEAVEAHRKGKTFPNKECKFSDSFLYSVLDGKIITADPNDYSNFYMSTYEEGVKGTISEEMADTVIRLLDTTYGFNWVLQETTWERSSTGNFTYDIIILNDCILSAFLGTGGWGYVLSGIIAFCSWYGIDLYTNVKWKMKYNEYRPYKHNKEY